MGYEKNYPIKILSNLSNNRKFSTLNPQIKLNPWFITGLIDAEGSFITYLNKNIKYKVGWHCESKFQISLHICDIVLLLQLQEYFWGIGSISKTKNMAIYYISKLSDFKI